MPNVIHHAQRPHQVHHSASWYLLVGMAVLMTLVLILSLLPVIVAPRTAFNPVAYRESVYLDYLQGEKIAFANPLALSNAFIAYHAGEKAIYDVQVMMQVHNFGEKTASLDIAALNLNDALYKYRMSEKDIQ
jgi:hypothetical protein